MNGNHEVSMFTPDTKKSAGNESTAGRGEHSPLVETDSVR